MHSLTAQWIVLGFSFALLALNLSAQEPTSAPAIKPKVFLGNPANIRKTLAHLTSLAEENNRHAQHKKTGNALADFYIRQTATYCLQQKISIKEFLIALGIGLDPSDFLRQHPLTREHFRPLDTDADTERRRRALGQGSLRNRSDWLLHFALSAALTAAADAETAEILGLLKELNDALGGSGFSFADLAADYAGVAFATSLLARPERLDAISKTFQGDTFLPPINDLEEGLALKALQKKYGDIEGKVFVDACRAVRQRIHDQAIFKTWKNEDVLPTK